MIAAQEIPRRLTNAKPAASLRGNLYRVALQVRSIAAGAGRTVVCAVNGDVHILNRSRALAKVVEEIAPYTVVGVYDQRSTREAILEDLQFAARQQGNTP